MVEEWNAVDRALTICRLKCSPNSARTVKQVSVVHPTPVESQHKLSSHKHYPQELKELKESVALDTS